MLYLFFRSIRALNVFDLDTEAANAMRLSMFQNSPFFGWKMKSGVPLAIAMDTYLYKYMKVIPFSVWDELEGRSSLMYPAQTQNLDSDFHESPGDFRVKLELDTASRSSELMLLAILTYSDGVPFATFDIKTKTITSRF